VRQIIAGKALTVASQCIPSCVGEILPLEALGITGELKRCGLQFTQ